MLRPISRVALHPSQRITVLIASGVRLYSEGLCRCLRDEGSTAVVGTCRDPHELLALVDLHQPAAVILDQALPAGLELVRKLQRSCPPPSVVALGMPDQEDMLLQWAEAGVAGFVQREASMEDLVETLTCAVRGELRCSPQFAGRLLGRLRQHEHVNLPIPVDENPLTPRECEIVRLIDRGLSNKAIAAALGIELATVKNHVHNLLEKLHVHRRGEAAARLRGRGVLYSASGRAGPP